MDLILQIWGGLFYLLNKMFFALSEAQPKQQAKNLKIVGWFIYLLGVPAWVIILISHQNWIAASIEAGGIPAMLLGLYNTFYDHKKVNRLLTQFVSFSTYAFLAFGIAYSVNIYGGITSLSQILEVGVMLGFLLGSYHMAQNDSKGWLFFMLMNISMATLMFLQDKPILMAQQLLSLCFVLYGFNKNRESLKSLAYEVAKK